MSIWGHSTQDYDTKYVDTQLICDPHQNSILLSFLSVDMLSALVPVYIILIRNWPKEL